MWALTECSLMAVKLSLHLCHPSTCVCSALWPPPTRGTSQQLGACRWGQSHVPVQCSAPCAPVLLQRGMEVLRRVCNTVLLLSLLPGCYVSAVMNNPICIAITMELLR